MRSRLAAQLPTLGVLASVVSLVFFGGWLLQPPPFVPVPEAPCIGPETSPVQRHEGYVQKFVKKLAEEASEIDSGRETLDIAFYGDSIAETWRGTDMGRKCSRCSGGVNNFKKYFGTRYKARVFAVGGDQTAHLQWRLLHGELMVQNPPRVAVLMIGTNDLGAAAGCFEAGNKTATDAVVRATYARIEAIIDFLRNHTPSTKVILLGLTPRGVWSEASGEFEWPSIFTGPIDSLNHILRQLAAGQETVHYVDCGERLLNGGKIDRKMQGDGLHPTLGGLSVLASCVLIAVEGILGPGDRPPNFLDSHPLPLRLWVRDQAASGSFWGA